MGEAKRRKKLDPKFGKIPGPAKSTTRRSLIKTDGKTSQIKARKEEKILFGQNQK